MLEKLQHPLVSAVKPVIRRGFAARLRYRLSSTSKAKSTTDSRRRLPPRVGRWGDEYG